MTRQPSTLTRASSHFFIRSLNQRHPFPFPLYDPILPPLLGQCPFLPFFSSYSGHLRRWGLLTASSDGPLIQVFPANCCPFSFNEPFIHSGTFVRRRRHSTRPEGTPRGVVCRKRYPGLLVFSSPFNQGHLFFLSFQGPRVPFTPFLCK